MKNWKFLALAVLACFVFASCNSVDSLIDKYEKACKAGDTAEMAKISQQLNDKKGDLTTEQTKHLMKVSMDCAREQAGTAMKAVSGRFEDVADDMSEAMEDLDDDMNDAMDELDLD